MEGPGGARADASGAPGTARAAYREAVPGTTRAERRTQVPPDQSSTSAASSAAGSLLERLHDPDADPGEDRARLRFAVSLLGIGVLHFVAPRFFVRIVPRWFPWAEQAVFWSGVAEVGSGLLVAVPRTRRIGGWLAALTIVAVYPANIQMAIDATRGGSKLAAVATWLRLPMQFPRLARALRGTR